MMYTISYYIEPRYIGTRLFALLGSQIWNFHPIWVLSEMGPGRWKKSYKLTHCPLKDVAVMIIVFKLIVPNNSCDFSLPGESQINSLTTSQQVQVVAWCRQRSSHYRSRCWPRSVSTYGITRPQWVYWFPMSWVNRLAVWCSIHSGWKSNYTCFRDMYLCIFLVYRIMSGWTYVYPVWFDGNKWSKEWYYHMFYHIFFCVAKSLIYDQIVWKAFYLVASL